MGRDLETLFEVAEAPGFLLLTPRPGAPTPYGKVEVHLKEGFLERVVYYDQRGQAVRELLLKGYQGQGGPSSPGRRS
ncbi:hypothetical protein [Thermus sediminis]|uniref:hypothetical protein n=1 Tax=Thermus sediminis TaxID=1761908 RepID=UPI001E4CCD52|nr:hypothetical protein [Thermus sediminis]